MARLKLKPLAHYPFSTEIRIRITDINFGGHLGNDQMLSLINEARSQFLAGHGFTELDCGGVSTMMTDAAIVYQGEAFLGDVLKFEVAAGEPTGSGFKISCRITRASDGKPIGLAETGLVCIDYKTKKILALPDAIRAICTANLQPTKVSVFR
ncbi:acyl-CoA thioesterase [Acidobacteriota bacterium]